jgi:hypothetical protein
MVKRLYTERSSLDTPFWQNHGQQNHFLTTDGQDLHGWAEMRRAMLGHSQAGAVLSNPFASELARDCETPAPILLRKWPYACASLRDPWEKNTGLRLVSKRGCVVKKQRQDRLRVSFPQQIQHSHSETTRAFFCLSI